VNPPTAPHAPRSGGLVFEARFATSGGSPFEGIAWEYRDAEIVDERGRVLFRQEQVEVPADWSQLATTIAVSKYFHGDAARGDDPRRGGREHSVRQLIERVTRSIADWGREDGYFADAASAEAFYRDLSWLCLHQHGAFNSPVWFNVGLHRQYGIGGGKGNWHWDAAAGRARRAAGAYHFPQASACFIQGVEDSVEGIMRLAAAEARLFKFGSGTGTDLSTLRSTRESLSGGGRPAGPLAFLRIFDQVANAVKSGGKTRRAAKMNTLKDWHPDIAEFIDAKMIEEGKARALIAQGYDGSCNGEAYGSVMFQNENLSVRAGDDFMRAAAEGREWWTRRVGDGLPCERKDARELLRAIARGAWTCGDPGMQFDDTIHRWHTCKASGRQHSSNPCAEYLFLNDSACNLASLNLCRFEAGDGSFDIARFEAAVRIFLVAQEILVDRASYPTRAIAENSHAYRTLGLGHANLGALVMRRGLAYDSDEARALAAGITALMSGTAYQVSAELAAVKGCFPAYEGKGVSNAGCMLEVIARHRDLAHGLVADPLSRAAGEAWDRALAAGLRHGFRNAQVTLLAPTGTIGFLMDCDTTGIEPDIALVKYKRLAGGGVLKIVNRSVETALRRLGYGAEEIAGILGHIERWDSIEDVDDPAGGARIASGLRAAHLPVFDCAFKPCHGRRSLTAGAHLSMMAAVQPFLSGGISKTVNLPASATVEEITAIFQEAWRLGLKAVAIYRDGSKGGAPLATRRPGERGEPCPDCGAEQVLRDGACGTCAHCGAGGGCG